MNIIKLVRFVLFDVYSMQCGGGGGGATVDAEAERLKAEATATTSANQELIAKSRRKRKQKGLLSAQDERPSTVLTGGYDPNKKQTTLAPSEPPFSPGMTEGFSG